MKKHGMIMIVILICIALGVATILLTVNCQKENAMISNKHKDNVVVCESREQLSSLIKHNMVDKKINAISTTTYRSGDAYLAVAYENNDDSENLDGFSDYERHHDLEMKLIPKSHQAPLALLFVTPEYIVDHSITWAESIIYETDTDDSSRKTKVVIPYEIHWYEVNPSMLGSNNIIITILSGIKLDINDQRLYAGFSD